MIAAMHARRRRIVLAGAMALGIAGAAHGQDVLGPAGVACRPVSLTTELALPDVIEHALCRHPQTRQAWAQIEVQTAGVGVQRASFLPAVNGTLGVRRGDLDAVAENNNRMTRSGGINLSWTLLDAGLRSANAEQARQLLSAATALKDASLQQVFMRAAQAYYDVLDAQAAVEAGNESLQAAEESLAAAGAKHRAGVGTLSDQLQAQTQHAEARLNRIRLETALKDAQGALALAMGLDANAPLQLRATDNTVLSDNSFMQSVEGLIAQARRTHPALAAAQAQVQAAQAELESVRAEGRPSVTLTGAIHRQSVNTTPAAESAPVGKSIGVLVNIPLFEGFGRSHRVHAARMQLESKTAALDEASRQVSYDIWKSYQGVRSATESLSASAVWQQSAVQAFDVARGRYKAGVGTILEMLNAQSALANVRQQRIQAVAAWRVARLKLAASLGRLGLSSLHEETEPDVQAKTPVAAVMTVAASDPPAEDRRAKIVDALQRWLHAWSARDLEAYFSAYDSAFRPAHGQTRQAWEQQRRQRIAGKRHISVAAEDPKIMLTGDTASVRFRQRYQSDTVAEDSMKTLVMVRGGDGWRIVEESQ